MNERNYEEMEYRRGLAKMSIDERKIDMIQKIEYSHHQEGYICVRKFEIHLRKKLVGTRGDGGFTSRENSHSG